MTSQDELHTYSFGYTQNVFTAYERRDINVQEAEHEIYFAQDAR